MFITDRSYESIYPKQGWVSIAVVKEIKDIGAYVSMIEYDFIQGMLMVSEISRRRIRSINRMIKIGKKEIVSIIRVDKKKGYIDVSKRQLAEGEYPCMKKKWFYSKLICSVSCHISKISFTNCEDSKIRWVWPLFRKFGHAIKGLKHVMEKKSISITGYNMPNLENKMLFKNLTKKIATNHTKIEIKFQINSYSSKGIYYIKEMFRKIYEIKSHDRLNICCLNSPNYSLLVHGNSKKKILRKTLYVLKVIELLVKKKKGGMRVNDLIIH